MKTLVRALALVFFLSFCATSQDLETRAWQMESKGDAAGAREFLARAARSGGFDALNAYAQFLDRHHDPEARAEYEKALNAAQGAQRALLARRLVELDLLAGSRNDAARDLELYRAAGGKDFSLPPISAVSEKKTVISIPGPFGSFARMAALSPEPRARRSASGAGAQRRHQRLSGRHRQRGAGADRVPEAGGSLSVAGARAGQAGRCGSYDQDRVLRFQRRPAICCACSGIACGAAAAAKWCWKR